MEWREICRVLSKYLLGFAGLLLLPLAVSLLTTKSAVAAFALTILSCLGLALLLFWIGRSSKGRLFRKEGLLLVVLIWVVSPALGGLPFWWSGTLNRFSESYFEASSGFTTVGLSILTARSYDAAGKEVMIENVVPGALPVAYRYYGTVSPLRDAQGKIVASGIEAVDKGLLFWRSFMQWLGGIGVVLLFITVLPALGVGAKVLMQAEMAGPIKEALMPRIRQTAMLFFGVYLGLTCLQVALLLLTNSSLPFFDAVTLALSTLSTGGFSVRNDNIAAYASLATESVVALFMLLGSINFALYYFLLRHHYRRLKDAELATFLLLALVILCCVVGNLAGSSMSFAQALRYGGFQVISSITSTGFTLGDYDSWPYFSQALLLLAMFCGGMSGSTAGGFKSIRLYLLAGLTKNRVEMVYRPETVRSFHYGALPIGQQMATTLFAYFVLYITAIICGTLFYIASGIDPETALTLTGSLINNGGLAFRAAGPLGSAAFLSPFAQYVSCFFMFLGRLEFFVLCILFLPQFWKSR